MKTINRISAVMGTWLVLLSSPGIPAQDLAQDLKVIRDYQEEGHWRKMNIRYTSFETDTSTSPEEQEMAYSVERGTRNYFFDNRISSSVALDSLTLLIDKEEEKMYLLDQPAMMEPLRNLPVDSLLRLCEQVEYIGAKGLIRTYRLTFGKWITEYQKMTLTLNMEQYRMEELDLYYRQAMPKVVDDQVSGWYKPRLHIEYTPAAVTTRDRERLKREHYIRLENGRWTTATPYAGYELIDQTQKP